MSCFFLVCGREQLMPLLLAVLLSFSTMTHLALRRASIVTATEKLVGFPDPENSAEVADKRPYVHLYLSYELICHTL